MPVTSFVGGDKFVMRVIKHHQNNPDRQWANTYEFQAVGPGTEATLLEVGIALVDFEAYISLEFVVFDRLNISTWAADSVPYNPASFISSSLSQTGANVAATDAVPITEVLSVTRVASSGRFGHLFYRGVLVEGDTVSPAGKAVLVNRPGKQSMVDLGLADSGLDQFIGSLAVDTLQLALISADGAISRAVTGLFVSGITQLPVDHAWFNRTPAP